MKLASSTCNTELMRCLCTAALSLVCANTCCRHSSLMVDVWVSFSGAVMIDPMTVRLVWAWPDEEWCRCQQRLCPHPPWQWQCHLAVLNSNVRLSNRLQPMRLSMTPMRSRTRRKFESFLSSGTNLQIDCPVAWWFIKKLKCWTITDGVWVAVIQ